MVSNICLFSLLLGEVIQFDEYFPDGLVQPPTKPMYFSAVYRGPLFFFGWQIHGLEKSPKKREGSSFLEVENQAEMGTVNNCKVFSVQVLGGMQTWCKNPIV